MRILMTVSSNSLMDGINRHVLTIAAALSAVKGFEIGVVTLHRAGDLNVELNKLGVKCWSLECVNGHQFKVISRFLQVIKEFKPDVVHEHVTAFFESVVLKWFCSHLPRVSTIHIISDPVKKIPLRHLVFNVIGGNWLCKLLAYSPADAEIYISHGVLDTVRRRSSVPAFVIYNPMCFPDDVHRSYCKTNKVIGTACRIENVKNPLAFTRIMGEVTKRLNNVEAWIIGDGAALMDCQRLVEDSGYKKIKFWGRRNDAKCLIAKMDCFILTSHREGMPTALLEAMAAKTPIAFMEGEGGLIDLAQMNLKEGPFGVVAPAGDELSLIDGICGLLSDLEKAAEYAERAFNVGRRNFDLDCVRLQLQNVYNSVCGR